ncbi:MAG: hypothetical protein NTV69_04105 [Caldilinea sp.]|nr:hypothetical protein [Caldilinea sp.]
MTTRSAAARVAALAAEQAAAARAAAAEAAAAAAADPENQDAAEEAATAQAAAAAADEVAIEAAAAVQVVEEEAAAAAAAASREDAPSSTVVLSPEALAQITAVVQSVLRAQSPASATDPAAAGQSYAAVARPEAARIKFTKLDSYDPNVVVQFVERTRGIAGIHRFCGVPEATTYSDVFGALPDSIQSIVFSAPDQSKYGTVAALLQLVETRLGAALARPARLVRMDIRYMRQRPGEPLIEFFVRMNSLFLRVPDYTLNEMIDSLTVGVLPAIREALDDIMSLYKLEHKEEKEFTTLEAFNETLVIAEERASRQARSQNRRRPATAAPAAAAPPPAGPPAPAAAKPPKRWHGKTLEEHQAAKTCKFCNVKFEVDGRFDSAHPFGCADNPRNKQKAAPNGLGTQ